MEAFLDKRYKLKSSENFDEYMQFLAFMVTGQTMNAVKGSKRRVIKRKIKRDKIRKLVLFHNLANNFSLSRGKLLTPTWWSTESDCFKISFFKRKTAATLSPVCVLTRNNDGSYTFTMESAVRNNVATFKLNEEFEEERIDGTKVKSIVVMDGNKLIHTQVESNGKKSTHEREFTDDLLTVTSTADGWPHKCVRVFAAV